MINLFKSKLFIKNIFIVAIVTSVMLILSGSAKALPTNTFSGVLKDQNGNAIRAVNVTLRDSSNNSFITQTAADGSFSIAANPAMYSLKLSTSSDINQSGLGQFSISQPTSIPSIDLTSGNITQNLTLPVATVNYTVYNPQGYGANNVDLTASATMQNVGSVSLYSGAPASSADGIWLNSRISPSGYTGQFKTILGTNFPAGSISIHWKTGNTYSSNVSILTNTIGTNAIDLPDTPAPNNSFSGVFKDSTGTAIPSAQITLQDAYNNTVKGNTNSTGAFNLAVRPGLYSMSILLSGGLNAVFGSFQIAQPVTSPSLDLTAGNLTQDFTLPIGTVNFTSYNTSGTLATFTKTIANGKFTSPISLYSGGVNFQLVTTVSHTINSNAFGTGSFKSIVGTAYQGTSTLSGICNYNSSVLMNCNTTPVTVALNGTANVDLKPRIATPTGLTAATPTALPSLSWQSVSNAVQYFIYRDNSKVGTSSTNSFVDNIGNGTYSYQISAVDTNGVESFPSNSLSVTVVQTPPTLDTPVFSSNPVFVGQTTSATVHIVGNLFGSISGEYFVGSADPGQGNGTPMSYSNGTFTSDLSGLSEGTYTVNFRARNNAGWGQTTSATLNVVKPVFSGYLKDQNGNAINGVLVQLRDAQNNYVNSQTASDGSFSIKVNPGLYSLKIYTASPVNQSGLGQFSLEQPISTPTIDLTATNITQNLTLPVGTVDFTLYNPQGYGSSDGVITAGVATSNVAPATLYSAAPASVATGSWTSNSITPDDSGVGHFKTTVGTVYPANTITIRWKGTGLYSSNASAITATSGSNQLNLPDTPPPMNTFSGSFKDSTGAAIIGAQFKLQDAYNNSVTGNTNSSGAFSLVVRPGMYALTITVSTGTVNAPLGSYQLNQSFTSPSIDLTAGNFTQNLTLPVGTVNYTAYDTLGNIAGPNTKVQGLGVLSSPISLYSGDAGFQLTTAISHNLSTDAWGVGSFKSIVGVTYQGSGSSNRLCTYTSSLSPPVTCSSLFTITSSTNTATIDQIP